MRSTLLKTLALGLGLLTLSIKAASPALGTATSANDAAHPLTYTAGPYTTPSSLGSQPSWCIKDDAFFAPCDVYRLTVSLPADYAQTNPGDSLFVRIEWPTAAADFDLFLFNGPGYVEGTTANPAATSAKAATNFEQVEIPAGAGTRTFAVQVNTTLPAGQSFTGKIWIGPATAPPVTAPGNASGIAPRFQGYIPTDATGAPSSSLGLFAGEPTMGINPKTGDLFYQGLFEILRLKFDDTTSPAKVLWEAKDVPTGISTKVTVDPILTTDLTTGRIWAMQLSGGQSVTDYSDDNGETWLPTISGGFASGADHQGMGSGPYPTTGAGSLVPHPLFPNAVYYCSQSVATAFCSRSDDGGLTFGPSVPIYDLVISGCIGLHGHPKVAPDGTVYVPNKGCKLDTPLLGQGKINVVVSEDAGMTWAIRAVPDSVGALAGKDPSVAIGKDGAVYLGYVNSADNHQRVAVSRDKGRTWAPSVDVGALAGVTHADFPAVVAGDAGRAAVAFFGTTYTGPEDPETMEFPGLWHLYVATTYDGGATWFVANTTPDDPVQGFGGIGNGGDNRNHYDFIDADIDLQGRIVVSNSIGCAASCPRNGGPNTFAKLAGIVRQSGGRRMYAQFDPVEPTRPAAPLLNGYRSGQSTVVNWAEPDHSGAPITGYNVYRRINGGSETRVATGTTRRQWFEYTAANNSYQYRVTAVSALGEGPSSNVFAPAVGQNAATPELSCTLPGQVYPDRTGEPAALPANDISAISVAEPQDMPGMLVFAIHNASPLAGQSNAEPFIYFDPASSGLRYRLSLGDNEIATFKNGQIDSSTDGLNQVMAWTKVGTLEAGSGLQPDGSFRFIVDKAKLSLKSGDVLLGVAGRQNVVLNPSGVMASDYAAGRQDYTLVGNDYCLNTAPVARLVADRTSGPAHLQVSFSGATSSDADAGDGIASYTFDFGDGSPAVTQAGATISHTYTVAGSYTATLSVADSRQKASAAPASVAIQVLEPVQAPEAFTFSERTNVPAYTFITSEAVTLSGFTGSLPISIDNGGQYSIDGGAFTNAAGNISVGQTLVVRHISANTDNTAKESTVTVGSYSTVFRTVTGTFDRAPDPFDFGIKRNTAPNTLVASEARTLTGYDYAAIVAGPGAEYSVNGGAFTAANGTLTKGDTLRVRHTTQPNPRGYTVSYVTVGGVAGYFTTRNK